MKNIKKFRLQNKKISEYHIDFDNHCSFDSFVSDYSKNLEMEVQMTKKQIEGW